MMQFKKIVFLDSQSEREKYTGINSEYKNSYSQEHTLIAMNPSVYSHFKKIGVSVQSTLPYFTNESHTKALEKSKVIIDWLRENAEFTDLGLGIQHAYRHVFVFFMRFAIHNCLWIIEVISNTINMHEPEVICALFSSGKHVSSLYLEPEERYLGYIAKRIAQEKKIKFENFSADTNSKGVQRSSLREYLSAILKFILKYEKFRLWEKRIALDNILTKKRPIFFTSQFYQLDKLANEFQKEHSEERFYFLRGPIVPDVTIPDFLVRLDDGKYAEYIAKQRGLFNALIEAIEKEKTLFSYRDIYFGDIISKKIKDNLSDYVLRLMLWTVKLNHFVDATSPSLFISNGNRSDDVALAEICRQKNIPSVLISHGSHVRPKNNSEIIEWGEHGKMLLSAPFSHLVLQTPVSEGYLEVFPSSKSMIKTGPLIWGKPVDFEESKALFKKMFDGRYNFGGVKVVLHASTPKPNKGLRFCVYETPDEYISALRGLAEAVEKISNTILIIKFRPSFEIGIDDIKTSVPFSDKVILSVEESFTRVLGMTDLLVSFSSTTIEEALQNRIPVLLYGGAGRYQHIPAYGIKPNEGPVERSAVYHVEKAQDLEYAIPSIFRLNIDGRNKDKSLFEQYIYSDDVREGLDVLLKL